MQPILKYPAVDRLEDELRTGQSLKSYFSGKLDIEEGDIIRDSNIELGTSKPNLKSDGNVNQQDLDNAIKLHKYMPNLNRVQASDKRLWTYLTHVEFFEYAKQRWGYATEWTEIESNREEKIDAIKNYREHWFIRSSARGLERNALARLWWGAQQTYAPWEVLSGAGISEFDNKYIYTNELFRSQDTFVQLMGRSFFWDKYLLIAVLEYLRRNPQLTTSDLRSLLRKMVKSINLLLGSRRITFMNFNELVEIVETVANEVI